MRIVLLGATGRTGKLVLETALEKGHQVICLARDSQRIQKHDHLKVIEGNPQHLHDMRKTTQDVDCIISTLNISRTSDFPWAKLRTSATFLSEVMKNCVQAAKENNVNRIITCSAWGVAETRDDIPFWFRWLIDYSNIGVAYKDHEQQERLLKASALDWTIVRPTGLTNAKKSQKIRKTFGNNPKPSLTISRSSVAKFMVDAISASDMVKKTVVISKD